MDIDIHGPSIPKLLNLENRKIGAGDSGIIPTGYGENLKVMSIGFLLQNQNEPVIWRGPMKYNVIKQFLEDVAWGSRAQNLYMQNGIQVITGTASEDPKMLLKYYLAGILKTGEGICDH